MHIVILSDAETSGGAAMATSRLAEGLLQRGHQVTRLVDKADPGPHAWSTHVFRGEKIPSRPKEWLESHLRGLSPDIINVHNIHGALSVGWGMDFIRSCLRAAPTFWTLHDMWSFTGRCAYRYDCEKNRTGCDASCPTAGEYPRLEPAHIARAWQEKRNFFEDQTSISAVAPSRWLAEEAQQGFWSGHSVHHVPYGLALDRYPMIDRDEARNRLGLRTAEGPFLLFTAQHLGERRKGGALLVEALHQLHAFQGTVLLMGNGELSGVPETIRVRHLGYVSEEEKRILAYNAADLIVHPAPVDNLPCVVIEAIACGTPVVGFPVGGVPEMVQPHVTGWLSPEVSPTALSHTLKRALKKIEVGEDLRHSCRALAEGSFSIELEARRYDELFKMTAYV